MPTVDFSFGFKVTVQDANLSIAGVSRTIGASYGFSAPGQGNEDDRQFHIWSRSVPPPGRTIWLTIDVEFSDLDGQGQTAKLQHRQVLRPQKLEIWVTKNILVWAYWLGTKMPISPPVSNSASPRPRTSPSRHRLPC
jgi:hypothetical protein